MTFGGVRKGIGIMLNRSTSLVASALPAGKPRHDFNRANDTRPVLERLLVEDLIPFWLPAVLDHEAGGYRLNHDGRGRWRGPAPRRVVSQARTLWFFSRLARSPWGSEEALVAAQHGFRFLESVMWDPEYGGFFWEIEAASSTPTMPDKHLCGQAFALFAIAEYARSADDPDAVTFAREIFDMLERRFHDPAHGGYREFLRRDWRAVPEDEPGYLGQAPAGLKLMGSHLHVMEALSTLCRLTGDPLHRERLVEMIGIMGEKVVRRRQHTFCTDRHRADWSPLAGRRYERVSYGHDVENVSLLIEACEVAGLPHEPLSGTWEALFANALRFGQDHGRGFFFAGAPGRVADDRSRVWWVQAEALLAALRMYRLTGRQVYLDCYFETLDWIVRRQVSRTGGDWYRLVGPLGRAQGAMADGWKSPYHNGRAVLECLAILDDIRKEPAGAA